MSNEWRHSLINDVKLLKVLAENTEFGECRGRILRHMKNKPL